MGRRFFLPQPFGGLEAARNEKPRTQRGLKLVYQYIRKEENVKPLRWLF
jgi:hypothetical protein